MENAVIQFNKLLLLKLYSDIYLFYFYLPIYCFLTEF